MNMKSLFILSLIAFSLPVMADVSVKGYYRKDGTYVKPHMRSSKDGNFYNNWSTVGNVNPYTGKQGTKIAPTYSYTTPKQNVGQVKTGLPYSNYQGINTGIQTRANQLSTAQATIKTQSYPSSVQFNGMNWIYLSESNTDAVFVAQRKKEYWSGYPVVAIMYLGVKTPQGNLTWKGKKIVKVVVNCQANTISGIAEAIINSQDQIIKNETIVDETLLSWQYLGNFFDVDRFQRVASVCNNDIPAVYNLRG